MYEGSRKSSKHHSTLPEKISILVEIKDPVAVEFYKAMPEGLRPVYAEVLLTGAAYLASQKDFTSESIRVIESAAVESSVFSKLRALSLMIFPYTCPSVLFFSHSSIASLIALLNAPLSPPKSRATSILNRLSKSSSIRA